MSMPSTGALDTGLALMLASLAIFDRSGECLKSCHYGQIQFTPALG
jgi:hypothetical protein